MERMKKLEAEREALLAAKAQAEAEWKAKVEAVEAEMRKEREASNKLKPGDVIEGSRHWIKISKVYIGCDYVSVYGVRKLPSGRWSKKVRPMFDWDFKGAEG